MASRKQEKTDRKARIEQMRTLERARQRRVRIAWLGGGGVAVAAVAAAVAVLVIFAAGNPAAHEVIPPAITGQTTVEPAALTVPNTTGITGVVAYDTTGYPSGSRNGPAGQALGHTHVTGPVRYSVTPPVGGNHNAAWMTCGVYDKPVPNEHAVHNLEHGAVWITYQPSLPQSEVSELYAFFGRQAALNPGGAGSSRYLDITPYPGLPSPIVASSWGFQLRLTSPADPRLQEFVDKFRVSKAYTPEYGAPCTGGTGTPRQQ
jgi:Protein of unknown function (DUF3105)